MILSRIDSLPKNLEVVSFESSLMIKLTEQFIVLILNFGKQISLETASFIRGNIGVLLKIPKTTEEEVFQDHICGNY